MSNPITHDDLISIGSRLLKDVSIYKKTDATITYKSKNDAVTAFDIYLQQKIFTELSNLDPNVHLLSEEKIFNCDSNTAWIIDPLDGTSNFIQELLPSAIVAAKVCEKDVLAALVVNISNGDIYTAILGGGSKLNANDLVYKTPSIKLLGASTGYLNRDGKIPKTWNVRVLGSQALHLCMVARGVLSGCVNFEAKAWDDVAGSLIISEAGGSYTNLYPEKAWVECAINSLSLNSVAAFDGDDFIKLHSLSGEINNG